MAQQGAEPTTTAPPPPPPPASKAPAQTPNPNREQRRPLRAEKQPPHHAQQIDDHQTKPTKNRTPEDRPADKATTTCLRLGVEGKRQRHQRVANPTRKPHMGGPRVRVPAVGPCKTIGQAQHTSRCARAHRPKFALAAKCTLQERACAQHSRRYGNAVACDGVRLLDVVSRLWCHEVHRLCVRE